MVVSRPGPGDYRRVWHRATSFVLLLKLKAQRRRFGLPLSPPPRALEAILSPLNFAACVSLNTDDRVHEIAERNQGGDSVILRRFIDIQCLPYLIDFELLDFVAEDREHFRHKFILAQFIFGFELHVALRWTFAMAGQLL